MGKRLNMMRCKMQPKIDVIIPTYNNLDQLISCVQSMINYSYAQPIRIIIVNNGDIPLENYFPQTDDILLLNPSENLNWCGGLELGLKHSDSEFVLFANDDIFIPRASSDWLKEMLREIRNYPQMGAIGPISNVVCGEQNMWGGRSLCQTVLTSYLIGFCLLVRREALDKAGGIQEPQYGGDDFDLSIRLRKAGYKLAIKKNVFVYHHGFQTGEQIHGKSDKPNGWNSREMTDNVNMELIRKHGFKEWAATIKNEVLTEFMKENSGDGEDTEAEIVRQYVIKDKPIVELGCGFRKTVEDAVGVDRVENGQKIPYVSGESLADVVADVSKPLPFKDKSQNTIIARHVLEHCLDVVSTLKEWVRILADKGRLIISCPDENIIDGIPTNPEHKHAFTPDSIKSICELLGLKEVGRNQNYNGISFTICMEKI